MIKAIIFDVGGVLHNDLRDYLKNDITSTLGISEKAHDQFFKKYDEMLSIGKISEKDFWELFVRGTKAVKPLPKDSLFVREFDKNYKIFNDVIDLVRRLKKNGYKVAILSNTIKSHADVNIKKGAYDEFEIKILSYEVGFRKPDEQIYMLALRRLNVKSEEAVFIDDNPKMVKGANAVGIFGIVFESYKKLVTDLKTLGIRLN